MRRLAILVLAIAALAAPPHSSAAETSSSLPQMPGSSFLSHLESRIPDAETFRSGFRLEARGGYDVEVTTSGTALFLVVRKGKFDEKRFVGTAYIARGLAKPERLRARFGKYGEVSMRFRESPNKTWVGKRRNCRGEQRFVKRRGLFVGSFKFRSGDKDIVLDARRAKGSVVTVARKCLRQRSGPEPPIFAEESSHQTQSAFIAVGRDGVDFTGFLAVEGKKQTTFLATNEETRGKLAITNVALVRHKVEALRANEALTRARISPPAPFHGTGLYRAAPDGTTTWSGSLSVNFPGAPRFSLVGPNYETLIEVPF